MVVVGGTHGNEYTGVWCVKSMESTKDEVDRKYKSLSISTLIGNPVAFLQNRRFVDTDLNREFTKSKLSEEKTTTVESKRAKEVNEILGPKFGETTLESSKPDVVIDLHTTTTNMGLSIIIAEGDAEMSQAAAYVMMKCSEHYNKNDDSSGNKPKINCLMHSIPQKEYRPNLSSISKHGFTIEVGPTPQSVLRHDIVELTQLALDKLLEFFNLRNTAPEKVEEELRNYYPNNVACFQSAPARRKGEMSGKIVWPCDEDNPNFPKYLVHKSLQDQDFQLIKKGDPLFVDLKNNVIPYDGSHGDEVYLMFVNEGGYYYASSGTGISVAVKREFDLRTGMVVDKKK